MLKAAGGGCCGLEDVDGCAAAMWTVTMLKTETAMAAAAGGWTMLITVVPRDAVAPLMRIGLLVMAAAAAA